MFFFKTPERIIYLTRWIIKILPFIDLFSDVGNLPLQRTDNDFLGYIKLILNNYLKEVTDIYNNIPEKYNVVRDSQIIDVHHLSGKIYQSISEYLNGYPKKAFDYLDETIETNLMADRHLDNIMTIWDTSLEPLYKMRIGTDNTFTSKEMLHIPFQLRGLVNTNRYSIPGLPCVYLGSSPLTCWEELNKPDLNTVQTSLFIKKDVSYLDLSISPGAIIDILIGEHQKNGLNDHEMKDTYKDLASYIVVWPLMAACSIRVKNPKDTFKPEYIFPQLLLQWIRQSKFDGVCYFSTKVEKYTARNIQLYKNYAFPVQTQEKEGYCSVLNSKFDITEAVPWRMFQLYKDTKYTTPNTEAFSAELEFVNGLPMLYYASDFSRLETFLFYKYEEEKKSQLICGK
ncbi:RES domain-containing protein [Lysinibacillus sp. NPDC097279]|uniref:RES domain-containing protein n=1 Tax=Lysinibacillus sp. NPDC097279 TaxID=3364143 RepID=UPI0037F773CA